MQECTYIVMAATWVCSVTQCATVQICQYCCSKLQRNLYQFVHWIINIICCNVLRQLRSYTTMCQSDNSTGQQNKHKCPTKHCYSNSNVVTVTVFGNCRYTWRSFCPPVCPTDSSHFCGISVWKGLVIMYSYSYYCFCGSCAQKL